jgi:hypothetical protein
MLKQGCGHLKMLKNLPISIEKVLQSLRGSFSGVPDVLSGSGSI